MKSGRDLVLDRPGGRDAVAVGRGSVPAGVAVGDGSQIDLADAATTINHPSVSPSPSSAARLLNFISFHPPQSFLARYRPHGNSPFPPPPTNFAPRCCVGNICSVLSCQRRLRLQQTRNKQLLRNIFSLYQGRRGLSSRHFPKFDENVKSDLHTRSAVAVATITKRIYSVLMHSEGKRILRSLIQRSYTASYSRHFF